MAVATEGKTSGARESGPVLDPASLEKFSTAVAEDHVTDPPAAEPPPPAAPPPPEPKVEAPPAEPPPAAEPPAPAAEPPPEDPLKAAQAKVADYERQLAEQAEQVDLRARAEAGRKLGEVAAANPWLAPYIYGEKDPAKEPPTPPAAPLKPGETPPAVDPNAARFATIERQLKEERAWREQRERETILDDIQAKAEAQMKRYPQLQQGHPMYNAGAELIAHKLKGEPKSSIESIVDRVGTYLKGVEEKIKAEYVQGKKAVAAKVAPGVGPGAAAPPGSGPVKQKWDDNSIPRAMARAMDIAAGKVQG